MFADLALTAGDTAQVEVASRIGSRETLSAITIRSLADLGYGVDASLAEPYTLPGLGAAGGEPGARDERPGAVDTEPGRTVDLGDDVLRGPVRVVDAAGRVVRLPLGR